MKMRNTLPFLLGSVLVLAVSCQKEVDYQNIGGNNPGTGDPGTGNPSNNSIIGDWKFKKMAVEVHIYSEVTSGGLTQKIIGDMPLSTSTNETGILKIDAATMTASNIGYLFNSSMTTNMYANGMLVTSNTDPVQVNQAPSNRTTAYTKIGADSLVAETQLITIDYPGLPSIPDTQHGLKVSWLGDTLVLTERINQQTIDNSLGIPIQSSVKGLQTIKLVKN
ncbi:MAG TPA: hypothetical protein VHN59_14940 [Chitinophagaceae bacterium]|nr:hypothetical protein [Chitinophagaceae bacterium]